MALTDGLVLCWDFDEASGNRVDHVHGVPLYPVGGPAAVPGKLKQAVQVQAAPQQYLHNGAAFSPTSIGEEAKYFLLDASFTMLFWIYIDAYPPNRGNPDAFINTGGLLTNGPDLSYAHTEFCVLLTYDGTIMGWFSYAFGGMIGRDSASGSSAVIPLRTWTRIALWRALAPTTPNVTLHLQIDDGPILTTTRNILPGGLGAAAYFTVGAVGGTDGTASYGFDGKIDAIMLWNRALGDDERTAIWNSGAGLDCTFTAPPRDCPQSVIPNFHDVLLAPYIRYGCKIKLRFQTFVTRMRAGHEERIGEWQDPLWVFDITPALRDQADLDDLLAFFRARNGPQFMFKFLNPIDYQADMQFFAFGDGTKTEFQLTKQYPTDIPGDGQFYVRPIFLPVEPVVIFQGDFYGGNTPVTACVDYMSGVVTFDVPPASGSTISWSGEYYTLVRFLTNRVYSVIEHYQNFEDQIMLIEERLQPHVNTLNELESPDFVNTRFPEHYAQRASIGPEVDVLTIASDSGGTFRQPQWQHPKIRFTVEETEQSQETVQSLMAFFLNRKGRLYGFRARDITDFDLNPGGGVAEPPDGVRTEFQLVKRYESQDNTSTRYIVNPNEDVVVAVDGVPVENVEVQIGTGRVIFNGGPPPTGATITVTGSFDVPVRFDDDEMTLSIQGFEAYNMEAMGLIEIEFGLPTFTVDTPPPAPALLASRAAAAPRALLPGQQNCQLPPRPAVTQYLEFRGGTTPSGAGAYSGLQVDHPGSMYKLLAGATSCTFAILVSHVKSGTPSGAVGAVYPMALFSHVMPGMGTDPSLYASTGLTIYLDNFGAGIALDVSLGAYTYGTSGALCVPQLTLTPRLPAQGAQSASLIADNDTMHAYVVTMDWVSRQAYWSGTIYGRQDFPVEAFAYATCFAGVGGADARLMEHTAAKYIGALDGTLGQGETANDAWLGVVSQTPHSPAFHSPLSAFVYEQLFLPTFLRVDMQRIVRDVHTPILKYWGSKYGTGFPNVQAPTAPGFDLFWWRADENISLADPTSGAIHSWGPVACGFAWLKANPGDIQDDGQPRQGVITTRPVLSDVLMLADGRRLLARQT